MKFSLANLTPEDIEGGFRFLDIGSSGHLDAYWTALFPFINLTGFDPNKEECERLGKESNPFLSAQYLPYAISGSERELNIYKTRSKFCWSSCRPNNDWLRRFTFGDFFEIEGEFRSPSRPLSAVPELEGVDVDIIKCDTQGLEEEIFSSAGKSIKDALAIETETGFCENYIGETRFDQIAGLMVNNGFGLFDLNISHRKAKKNELANRSSGEQILWGEALWIRDVAKMDTGQIAEMGRGRGLKALLLHANHGSLSSGLEIAQKLMEADLITSEEFENLEHPRAWNLESNQILKRALRGVIDLVPRRHLGALLREVSGSSGRPHLLKRLFR